MMRRPQAARGFTLLEVLAAVALLAIAFAVALGALGSAARMARRSAALDTAVERAQSLLAGQGLAAPLAAGTQSGHFDDGRTWTLTIRALPRAPQAAAQSGTTPFVAPANGALLAQASAIDLYQLDVAVQYGAHRTLRLATERAQAAQAGPGANVP